MLLENGIIRVGAEIEVAAFRDGVRYQEVAGNLVDAGFMEEPAEQWNEWHTYNCKCRPGGCDRVSSGNVLVPPIVSMQYDASLPTTGAEFIVSPVLLIDGMDEMRAIWEIITRNAVWDNTQQRMRGAGEASPSIHLHVSATSTQTDNLPPLRDRPDDNVQDALHALSLFGPELLLLSDVEEFRRGLAFRQPWRHAEGRGNHHGFVHVRSISPGRMAYIEWRMWEAAYGNWDYFEAAAYLSAALTRALMREGAIDTLFAAGYRHPPDRKGIEEAIRNDDTMAALALASPQRLAALHDVIIEELADDERGERILAGLFAEVTARV